MQNNQDIAALALDATGTFGYFARLRDAVNNVSDGELEAITMLAMLAKISMASGDADHLAQAFIQGGPKAVALLDKALSITMLAGCAIEGMKEAVSLVADAA